MRGLSFGVTMLCAIGCGSEAQAPSELLFEPDGGFWDSPFPSAHRGTSPAGGMSLAGLSNPERISLVSSLRELIESDVEGFGVSSTIYFRANGPLHAAVLPTMNDTLKEQAQVWLMDVDPTSPERGTHVPLRVGVVEDEGGPVGAPHLLALQPLQGWPLREGTLYAAGVGRALLVEGGRPLRPSRTLRQLLEGSRPRGFSTEALASYRVALETLAEQGMDLDELAGLTVFRTGHPSREFFRFVEAAQRHRPSLVGVTFAPREVFDDFCVFESEISLPDFQTGLPPYPLRGGGWPEDPIEAQPRRVRSRLVLTVPRAPMPASGFPTVLFVRTGGGGDRPLVDRGPRATPGGEAIRPGTGPALELARVGFAGLTWDGPHGGQRNFTGADEQFLVFNPSNPEALRDNVRQTALEAVMLADGVSEVRAPDGCPGISSSIRLDGTQISLMGHSMGATIAPLAAATGRFDALLLSGAGGSWIENVLFKRSPVPVRPLAGLLLGFDPIGDPVDRFDPILALLQWAGEPADPPVYLRRAREEGRLPHLLMLQGIGDTYIPAPVANATSLAARLDLGGAPTASHEGLLDLVGAAATSLPAGGNRDRGQRTAVLTQHPGDPVEDPHEVVFQTEAPKRQYRCFLRDLAAGRVPLVREADPCR